MDDDDGSAFNDVCRRNQIKTSPHICRTKPTIKTSRRDLAIVLSRRWNGGTTVAGTLIVADLVGIRVFATGGIGTTWIHITPRARSTLI